MPTRSVLYVMAAIMAAAAVVAFAGLRPGVQEDAPGEDGNPVDLTAGGAELA